MKRFIVTILSITLLVGSAFAREKVWNYYPTWYVEWDDEVSPADYSDADIEKFIEDHNYEVEYKFPNESYYHGVVTVLAYEHGYVLATFADEEDNVLAAWVYVVSDTNKAYFITIK